MPERQQLKPRLQILPRLPREGQKGDSGMEVAVYVEVKFHEGGYKPHFLYRSANPMPMFFIYAKQGS